MEENNSASNEGVVRKVISFLPNTIKAIATLADRGKDSDNPFFFWTIGLIAGLSFFGIWYSRCESVECERLGFDAFIYFFGVISFSLVSITVILYLTRDRDNRKSDRKKSQKLPDVKKNTKSIPNRGKKKNRSRKSKKQEIS